MTLKEVCDLIQLPDQVKTKVLSIGQETDIRVAEPYIVDLYHPDTWETAVKAIEQMIGGDPDGFRMLTLMLKLAAKSYEEYEKKGISETIFVDTMKFCTRFVKENYDVFGTYAFVWGWWFPRQISLHEFRIRDLEYEMIHHNGKKKINIHIPGDADISLSSVKKSWSEARIFFNKYYPDYGDAEMVCDSWLLSPNLEKLLPERSRILQFQKLFERIRVNEESDAGIRWVYGRIDLEYKELPERTSLQRTMKSYLLEGNHTGDGYGRLKEELLR